MFGAEARHVYTWGPHDCNPQSCSPREIQHVLNHTNAAGVIADLVFGNTVYVVTTKWCRLT